MPSSLFRTILTSLLIGLMMLGNAAAWAHHGTCNDFQCRASKTDDKPRCGSSHCCHFLRIPPALDVPSVEGRDASDHDSHGCFACQTAAAGGFVASLDLFLAYERPSGISLASSLIEDVLVAVASSQLRLRGPPLFFT